MMPVRAHASKLTVMLALICALCGAGLISGCDQTAPQKKLIQATWEQMKTACEGRDGQAALKVYNQATFDHYGKVVKLGVDGDYGTVLSQPPTTVSEILGMRTKATRAQLQKLDGKAFVAFAVGAGWWAESLDGLAIKDIKVAGDFATATMHYPELDKAYQSQRFEQALSGRRRRAGRAEKPPQYPVKFVKEADGWKFDELSMLPHWDRELNDECNESRMSMRDYMMIMHARDDEDKLPMSIWQPMPKK